MRSEDTKNEVNEKPKPEPKPNETSGLQVDDFLKITDPESGKVFIAKRGNS